MRKHKMMPLVVVALLAVSSLTMFNVVHKARNAYQDLQEFQRQYVEEKKAQHVLKAEWSYLNEPQRLRKMASKYLDTQKIEVAQIEKFGGNDSRMNIAANYPPSNLTPELRPVLTQYQGE